MVFVANAEDENHVRALIDQALASGRCVGPDSKLSQWEAADQGAGVLSESDEALGVSIAVSPGIRLRE